MTITNEILTAALVGLAQQKEAIDLKIASVEAMLRGKVTPKRRKVLGQIIAVDTLPNRRKMSAAARKAIGDATRRR